MSTSALDAPCYPVLSTSAASTTTSPARVVERGGRVGGRVASWTCGLVGGYCWGQGDVGLIRAGRGSAERAMVGGQGTLGCCSASSRARGAGGRRLSRSLSESFVQGFQRLQYNGRSAQARTKSCHRVTANPAGISLQPHLHLLHARKSSATRPHQSLIPSPTHAGPARAPSQAGGSFPPSPSRAREGGTLPRHFITAPG